MEKTKELVVPSYIYYKDPIQAVKSLLGNDVEIISTKVNHIILHNGYISVCVNYKALDFNSFKLYKILEIKKPVIPVLKINRRTIHDPTVATVLIIPDIAVSLTLSIPLV